jgi:hypothetical protein
MSAFKTANCGAALSKVGRGGILWPARLLTNFRQVKSEVVVEMILR